MVKCFAQHFELRKDSQWINMMVQSWDIMIGLQMASFLSKVGIRYGRHCFCIFFVSVSKELLSDNITAHSISSGARSASDDCENIRYVSKFVLARIFVCVSV